MNKETTLENSYLKDSETSNTELDNLVETELQFHDNDEEIDMEDTENNARISDHLVLSGIKNNPVVLRQGMTEKEKSTEVKNSLKVERIETK